MGAHAVLQLGYTREEGLSFPRHLREYLISHGDEIEEDSPEITIYDVLLKEFRGHFQSNPPTGERI